jgi:hypothetical protein
MDTSHGLSDRFGHADYYAALASGKSNAEILSYIQSNPSQLHNNRYGPGELVSQITAAAGQERQAAQAAADRRREIERQEQLQREAEARQAERLRQMEIGARTQAANTARAGLESSFQIRSNSKSPQTSGTQGFKRRKLQVNPTAYSAIAAGPPSKSTGVINV